LAKQQKIPALSLSHSNNFGRENEYNLIPEHTFYFYKELQKCFISRKNLNDYELSAIRDHYAGLLGGNKPWNYSEPSETKKIKKDYIRKDKKVLVCLSSPDENFAAQTVGILQTNLAHAFKNQLQWLKWVKKIAQKNPKILFWIRPHPRLYPNKRDSRHSELSTKLKLLREKIKGDNLIWPHQNEQGSLWQHLNNTNILFNAWSTVADEFGQKGIPVFTFFPGYNSSGKKLDITARNKSEYEIKFKNLLQKKEKTASPNDYKCWIADYLCKNTFKLVIKLKLIQKHIGKFLFLKNKKEAYYWALFKTNNKPTKINKIQNILTNYIKAQTTNYSRSNRI
jgi:hypothetical protein